jgi:hypothetical protein
MHFVYDVLEKTANQNSQPTINIDRLRLAARQEKDNFDPTNSLNNTVFGIAFQQLRNVPSVQLRRQRPTGTDPTSACELFSRVRTWRARAGRTASSSPKSPRSSRPCSLCSSPVPMPCTRSANNRDKYIPAPAQNSPQQLSMFREFRSFDGYCHPHRRVAVNRPAAHPLEANHRVSPPVPLSSCASSVFNSYSCFFFLLSLTLLPGRPVPSMICMTSTCT